MANFVILLVTFSFYVIFRKSVSSPFYRPSTACMNQLYLEVYCANDYGSIVQDQSSAWLHQIFGVLVSFYYVVLILNNVGCNPKYGMIALFTILDLVTR
ncbi:hypothetical protein KSS87_004146 [Heliosperma pusillum]|nr:hypothetical protein KSS87_004146 [Heliosperma pusillum]